MYSLEYSSSILNDNINSLTANTWNIDSNRLYSNWNSMLLNETGKLDAIVILTPIEMHYEMVKKVLAFSR